jgi:hypothetical protein
VVRDPIEAVLLRGPGTAGGANDGLACYRADEKQGPWIDRMPKCSTRPPVISMQTG